MSAPNRVRAKSNGYTTHSEVAPAAPPAARFEMNHLINCNRNSVLGSKSMLHSSPFFADEYLNYCKLMLR